MSPGGPAAEAGVKAGDVIVAIEAKPVATGRELVRAMEAIEPGEKVELGLKRDGKPLKLAVEARPLDRAFFVGTPGVPAVPLPLPALPALAHVEALPFDGDMHWLLDGWGDAEFVTLTPQLGRYFGADKGVLVARAPDDASLGLQDGDVIVAIGGREPQNGPHAMRILRSYQPGDSVELKILRDRRSADAVGEGSRARAARRDAPRRAAGRPGCAAPPSPPARRRARRDLRPSAAVLVCAAHAPRRLLLSAAAGTDRRPAAAAARREPPARARRRDGRYPRPGIRRLRRRCWTRATSSC